MPLKRWIRRANGCQRLTRRSVDRAWGESRALKGGMQAEFQQLQANALEHPALRKLLDRFRSPEAWTDQGLLVCRDFLDGLLPTTIDKLLPLTCLSHAMAHILVFQRRIKVDQVLSGLRRWADCLRDPSEREDFDAVASAMWPGCLRPPEQQPPVEQPAAAFPHTQGGDYHAPHIPGGQDGVGIPNFAPQEPAVASAAGVGHLSGNLSAGGQEDADVTAYLWSALDHDVSPSHGLGDINSDSFLGLLDSNDSRFWQHGGEIPGYPNQAPPRVPTPEFNFTPTPPDANLPPPNPPPSTFQMAQKVSGCPVLNLVNTGTFLVFVGFIKNAGACFYLLSGRGKTVENNSTGAASARERSKTVTKLRKEFFQPLKRVQARDPCFPALLSVAKKFVAMGLLRKKEKVHAFLFHVFKVGTRLSQD